MQAYASAARPHRTTFGVSSILALVAVLFIGLLANACNLCLGLQLPPLVTVGNLGILESPQSRELPLLIIDEPEDTEVRASGRFGPGWEINLTLLWAIGAASILMRFAIGYLSLLALQRGCTPVSEDSPWRADLRKQRDSSINIYSGDKVPLPLFYGAFRPSLLLSTTILEAPAKEDSMSIRHEMAHAKHGDGLFNFICMAATALHWPNPLARRTRPCRSRGQY